MKRFGAILLLYVLFVFGLYMQGPQIKKSPEEAKAKEITIHLGFMPEEVASVLKPIINVRMACDADDATKNSPESILIISRGDIQDELFEQFTSNFGISKYTEHASTLTAKKNSSSVCEKVAFAMRNFISGLDIEATEVEGAKYKMREHLIDGFPNLSVARLGEGPISRVCIQLPEMGLQGDLAAAYTMAMFDAIGKHALDPTGKITISSYGGGGSASEALKPGQVNACKAVLNLRTHVNLLPQINGLLDRLEVSSANFPPENLKNISILKKRLQHLKKTIEKKLINSSHHAFHNELIRIRRHLIQNQVPKEIIFSKETEKNYYAEIALTSPDKGKEVFYQTGFYKNREEAEEIAHLVLLQWGGIQRDDIKLTPSYIAYMLKTGRKHQPIEIKNLIHEIDEGQWGSSGASHDVLTHVSGKSISPGRESPAEKAKSALKAVLMKYQGVAKDPVVNFAAGMFVGAITKNAVSNLCSPGKSIIADVNMEDDLIADTLNLVVQGKIGVAGSQAIATRRIGLSRVHCDPFQISHEVEKEFKTWCKNKTADLDYYLSALLWGLKGFDPKFITQDAHWTLVEQLENNPAIKNPKELFFENNKIVVDPFWREIGTDFLPSIINQTAFPAEHQNSSRANVLKTQAIEIREMMQKGEHIEKITAKIEDLVKSFLKLNQMVNTDGRFTVWAREKSWCGNKERRIDHINFNGAAIDRGFYVSSNMNALIQHGAYLAQQAHASDLTSSLEHKMVANPFLDSLESGGAKRRHGQGKKLDESRRDPLTSSFARHEEARESEEQRRKDLKQAHRAKQQAKKSPLNKSG